MPSTVENCSRCKSVLKWIPVLFILSIIGWSYYAFVVRLCLYTIESIPQAITYLFLYHFIFGMFMWGYYQTAFAKVGEIPRQFKLPEEECDLLSHADNEEMQASILERCSKDLPVYNRTLHNTVRYCDKCCLIKPDRAHHCSVCRKCILKMDHHCPWVNNCVGFTNYKFFLLFLAYALIYCSFISLTSLEYFISFWREHRNGSYDPVAFDKLDKFHIIFLFFVGVMFAISLASLFFYHLYLVSVNRTTLEAFRAPIFLNGPDKNGFNLGRSKNFVEVFGKKPALWIFPVFSSCGDGISYQRNVQDEETELLLDDQNNVTYDK